MLGWSGSSLVGLGWVELRCVLLCCAGLCCVVFCYHKNVTTNNYVCLHVIAVWVSLNQVMDHAYFYLTSYEVHCSNQQQFLSMFSDTINEPLQNQAETIIQTFLFHHNCTHEINVSRKLTFSCEMSLQKTCTWWLNSESSMQHDALFQTQYITLQHSEKSMINIYRANFL